MAEVRYVIKNKDRFMENKDGFIFEDPIYLPQFVGATSNHPDNTFFTGTEIIFNPVPDMRKGDLCIVTLQLSYGFVIDSGGQTWIGPDRWNASVRDCSYYCGWSDTRTLYCVFNGEWSGNPKFGGIGNVGTGVMMVFRSWYRNWAVDNFGMTYSDLSPIDTNYPSNDPRYLVWNYTVPPITSSEKWNLSIASWFVPGAALSDVSWIGLSGSGWSQEGLSPQYRNKPLVPDPQDGTSMAFAYNISTFSQTTSEVTLTQVPQPGVVPNPKGATILNFSFYAY